MKTVISVCLYTVGLDNYATYKDVERYLYNNGVKYFKYDDNEDYGDIIYMIYNYLKMKKVKF